MSSEIIQKLTAQPRKLIMILSIVCFGFIITQQAWLNDDSFITLRVVNNFHEGHGLRWNIAERVQVYTHPLWMFLLSIVTFLTQEYTYTTLVLSILIGIAGFIFIWKIIDTFSLAVIISLILITSQSYVDYSTSGLENVLSHFLIISLVYIYLHFKTHHYYALFLGVMISLLLLNRLDLLLLIGPLIGWELWHIRSKRTVLLCLLGLSPIIIWELFSLIYYGFPVPNTAYSKINPSSSEPRFLNGLRYYLFSLRYDAMTLIGIIIGLVTAYITRKPLHILLSLGIICYLSYWVYVGGDYMGGRSFSVVLCVAVLIIGTSAIEIPLRQLVLAIALMLIFFNVNSMLHFIDGYPKTYVVNERDIYKRGLALSFVSETGNFADIENRYYTNEIQTETVFEHGYVGVLGFYGGPKLHVIDIIGLGDALIARLPPLYTRYPRPGHFYRGVPAGYTATWESSTNQIEDPQLAQFYEHLSVITQGPLWSWKRWNTIWNMNTGAYDHLIDQDRYTFYHLYQMSEALAQAMPQAIETRTGIQVDFAELRQDAFTQVKLDSTTPWRLIWYNDTTPVAEHTIQAVGYPHTQVQAYHLDTPLTAQQQGFNRIRILVESRETDLSYLFQGLTSTNQESKLKPVLELSAGWLSHNKEVVAPQINFVRSGLFEVYLPVAQTIQLAFTPTQIWQYPTSTTTPTGTISIQASSFMTTLPITVDQETIVSIPLSAGIHQLEATFDNDPPIYSLIEAAETTLYTRVELTEIRLIHE